MLTVNIVAYHENRLLPKGADNVWMNTARMQFIKIFFMKKWLIKSNDWYDNLKGAKRFLIFFIPIMVFIICIDIDFTLFGASALLNINLKIIGVCGICLMGLWRLLPKIFR